MMYMRYEMAPVADNRMSEGQGREKKGGHQHAESGDTFYSELKGELFCLLCFMNHRDIQEICALLDHGGTGVRWMGDSHKSISGGHLDT